MKYVRRNRKAVDPIKHLINPPIYTWTGNKAFKRIRGKRFANLAQILRDDEFLNFCSAIGWVEVNWAILEAQITHWCQFMFLTFKFRGINGKEKECPRAYARKVRYLRDGFPRVPRLAKFRTEGIDLLDRSDALSTTRHNLTHAVITHMESRNGKYFMENRRVQRDGRHIIEEFVFDVHGFPALGEELARLGHDALHFSHQLQIAFLTPQQSPQQPRQ